jgi:hypothetical protein
VPTCYSSDGRDSWASIAGNSQAMPLAELSWALTDPLDKNTFQVNNIDVVGSVPRTRLPNQDSRFCGRDSA